MLSIIVLLQPWTILQSLDKEKQREAISIAITTIYEGPVEKDFRITFIEAMKVMLNVILYPLTSTQLGVFSNFLDLKKLDVLKAVDYRARKFKESLLDMFVQEPSQEINQAIRGRRNAIANFDSLMKQPIMDLDAWEKNWKEFEKLPKMRQKRLRLRSLFREKLATAEYPLTELPSNILHQVIRKNPRLVTGMSHAFNVLGAVAAIFSVFREIFTPNSGIRQGNPRDVLSVVATAIGGVGSAKGTYDFAKVLKEKLFQPRRTSSTSFYGVRRPEELAETVEEELATEFAVDLNNMERTTNRIVGMMEPAGRLGAKIFTALGVVADGIFFGISVYDLYKDFTADSKDPWKIADDFAFAASAGVGAALGKL